MGALNISALPIAVNCSLKQLHLVFEKLVERRWVIGSKRRTL